MRRTLPLLLTITALAAAGCGQSFRDGLADGVEGGVSASITLTVEALVNALLENAGLTGA